MGRELLPNQVAVRWREGSLRAVRAALRDAELTEVPSQRIVIANVKSSSRAGLKRTIARLESSGAIEFASAVLRDTDSDLREALTDEITVRFKKAPVPAALLRKLAGDHGLGAARRNKFVARQFVFRVKDPNGLNTLKTAELLDELPEIEFAAPNFITEVKR